jgi:hypothetical protein
MPTPNEIIREALNEFKRSEPGWIDDADRALAALDQIIASEREAAADRVRVIKKQLRTSVGSPSEHGWNAAIDAAIGLILSGRSVDKPWHGWINGVEYWSYNEALNAISGRSASTVKESLTVQPLGQSASPWSALDDPGLISDLRTMYGDGHPLVMELVEKYIALRDPLTGLPPDGQSASPKDREILRDARGLLEEALRVCESGNTMRDFPLRIRKWFNEAALILPKSATPLQEARDRGATDEGYDNLVFADEIILKMSQRLDLDFSEMLWAEMNDDICDLIEARAALAAEGKA